MQQTKVELPEEYQTDIQFIKLELPKEYQTDIQFIKSEIADLKKNWQPKEPEEYLTRNEVAAMLKIDLSSIWNWTNRGILTSYQIGGRVYFKRAEVENAIVKLKK